MQDSLCCHVTIPGLLPLLGAVAGGRWRAGVSLVASSPHKKLGRYLTAPVVLVLGPISSPAPTLELWTSTIIVMGTRAERQQDANCDNTYFFSVEQRLHLEAEGSAVC